MSVLNLIKEWRKGCTCVKVNWSIDSKESQAEHPEDCPTCTRGLIDAIEKAHLGQISADACYVAAPNFARVLARLRDAASIIPENEGCYRGLGDKRIIERKDLFYLLSDYYRLDAIARAEFYRAQGRIYDHRKEEEHRVC